MQVLAHGGHVGLLAQRHGHRTAHNLESLRHAAFTRQHFHHMQTEAAAHQLRQHAHFNMAEQFAGEFGRAVAWGQSAQRNFLLASGAVGHFTR